MGLTIAQLQAYLTKAQQIVSEGEVIFKDAESGAETVLHSVQLDLGGSDTEPSSTVTITHGAAPAAPSPSEGETAPEGTNAPTEATAA